MAAKIKLSAAQQKIVDRLASGDICRARRTMYSYNLKKFGNYILDSSN